MKSSFTFFKPVFTAALSLLLFGSAKAIYVPVTVTGFTADVIANGVGLPSASTTAAFDNTVYCLVASDYQQTATSPLPTNFLPATGTINSVQTTGVSFQLANVTTTGNNSLRLSGVSSGTLTLSNQTYIGDIYILAAAGDVITTVGATLKVTFTDNTFYTFPSFTVADWFGYPSYAIQGIGRVNRTTGVLDAPSTINPRLYEYKFTMPIAQYSKQIASITVNKTGSNGTINVMAVTIDHQPCVPTTSVTAPAANITTTGATINWATVTGSVGYEYAITTTNTAPVSGTFTTATTYSPTGLTPGTTYYAWVRNKCSATSFSIWNSVSFTTLACPSAGAPSIVTNVPGSVTFTWPGTSTPGVINYQYQVSQSVAPPTTWLTTNNTTATISGLIPGTIYYAHVRSNCGTTAGDLYVQFTNPYPPCFAPAAMAIADVNMHGANISWNSATITSVSGYEYAVDMSFAAPSSGTATTDTFYSATGLTANTKYYVHIRTHCGTVGNYSAWILDSFTTSPTCLIFNPSNVQITGITAHTAQMTWQGYPGIYGYEYFIDNNSFPPTSGALAINYNVITPQNLYSGTSYYLHLRVRCDTFNFSPWIDIPFSTPAICTAPSTATVTNITSNSASFSWSPVGSAQNYEYGVSTSSTPSPTGFYTANTNVSVNALQPSTNYYFHVRALCSSSDLSEWKTTAFNTYATSIVTVAGNKDFSLNVYPNPVKEVLNIEVKGIMKGKGTVMLLDLSGKLIDQIELNSDKGQLNLKNVSSGLYLLRYRDGENTKTMRIQKQ
ncbi:MAG TPA: fibronectin type III domain-containing protein [Flavipsychrobacter sp.]|nr:fibronectin type III domain-containing protein [Flavipsychrobacter sp.]